MARFPGAIWKPITAGKGRKKLTVYNRMNLHVAASEASSLHGYFNQSGIPDSHFYVRRDGTVEQYVDTSMRAFADLEGNDATISVETQGMGGGGWTPQQRESLAQLYAWAVRTHGLARKLATSSKMGAASQGLSWHRLGIDGNFPSLPNIRAGRGQRGGGMHYSTSGGKVCPGDDRIPQIPGIFDRAVAILGGSTSKPTTPAQEEPDLNTTQAKQLSEIHAALGKLSELHAGTAPKIDRYDEHGGEKITWRTALKQIRLAVLGNLNKTVTAAVEKALANTTGVDKAAITKAVTTAVESAMADAVDGTEYVLTPKGA